MTKMSVLAAVAVFVVPAAPAFAQPWAPGSEIVGRTLQVQTAGVMNSVSFNADGTAMILAPTGESVPATWSAANNMLCLSTGGAQECWPYRQAFLAGQPVVLTSTCQAVSTWSASEVNQPLPDQRSLGERG